jgi:hypothetical protein
MIAAINWAKNQPQSAKDDAVDEQKQDQQEQVVVDRVPTEIMSVVTTPPTPAPSGSMIFSILSSNSKKKKKKTEPVTIPDGRAFTRECDNVNFKCQIRNYETSVSTGSLVDGGANGGLAGSDMRRIEMTLAKADVSGIGDTDLTDLAIGTFAAVIERTDGEIVGLFSQCADYGIGKSVHSSSQMRDFGLDANDVPRRYHGGLQQIAAPEGHVVPLKTRDGLTCMDMRPPTDEELAWATSMKATSLQLGQRPRLA